MVAAMARTRPVVDLAGNSQRSNWPRWVCLRILGLAFGLAAGSAAGQDLALEQARFRTWLDDSIWPRARAGGVSEVTFEAALATVTPDWTLPDLVPPGAARVPEGQDQAEFRAPGAYFAPNTVKGTAAIGRQMAVRHNSTLAALERRTGVPARVLLAIWGRESGFGRAPLPHNVFQVLATRGFAGRRSEIFATELIAALQIAEAGHAAPHEMRSSAAGALGQPQFLPSSFLSHAADGDGDGRADIWNSEPDTLASIATYLQRHGWVAGRDWGFEVEVPDDLSCSLEGPDQGRPIADWATMGIARVSGLPFPEAELAAEGYLMMPAGRLGPGFIVTPNFYVLKDYNTSDLYALFVGHVGDRIAWGVGDFARGWDEVDALTRGEVARLQSGLEALGHDVGGVDGFAGFRTRRSIGRWQEATGRAVTCYPNREAVSALVP